MAGDVGIAVLAVASATTAVVAGMIMNAGRKQPIFGLVLTWIACFALWFFLVRIMVEGAVAAGVGPCG